MIKRVPKHYVQDDIVQVRFPFEKNITVISSDFINDGVICHYDFNSDSQNINKYLTDTRRSKIPYGSIPMYKEIKISFFEDIKQINYINQIIKLNKHYISVSDDFCVKDWYLVKEEDTAIVYSRILNIPSTVKETETSRKKLEEEYKSNVVLCITNKGHYINLKKEFSTFFNDKGGLIIIRNEGELKFRLVKLITKGIYLFAKEYDICFNDYALEEIKFRDFKLKNASEPKIFSKLNPNINKKDVKNAKKLIKKLNKN